MKGQDIVVVGSVTEEAKGNAVPYTVIQVKGQNISVTTDGDGKFKLKVKSLPITLVAFQYGYSTAQVTLKKNQQVNIVLQSKLFNLDEVKITATKTETIQAKNNTGFLAFEFYDNLIVSLVNKGNAYNIIQIISDEGAILKEKKAPEGVERMMTDCFGNIQLLSKAISYQFYYDYQEITFMNPYPIEEFNSKVLPCQCVLGNYYYFKQVYHRNLKNRYFYITKNNPFDHKIITEVLNKTASDAFDKDYGLKYFLDVRKKGGGYSMSVDEITERLEELQENVPLDPDYLFKMVPVESELVKRDSFLLVIDYSNKLIKRYNFLGKYLKQDTLHLNSIYPKSIVDLDTHKMYFITDKKGAFFLYDYNMYENSLKKISIEGFNFIKNLRCRNGYLYFLDRDLTNVNTYFKIHKHQL